MQLSFLHDRPGLTVPTTDLNQMPVACTYAAGRLCHLQLLIGLAIHTQCLASAHLHSLSVLKATRVQPQR